MYTSYHTEFIKHGDICRSARFLMLLSVMNSSIPPSNQHNITKETSKKLRILVVDDEPAVLFAYRKLIERDGLAVDISMTLEEAITQIRKQHYLAVIADLRLAGTDNGDGLEILRIIQSEYPETKTILATGYGDSDVESAARVLGATHYFKKPVPPATILGALRSFHADAVNAPERLPS